MRSGRILSFLGGSILAATVGLPSSTSELVPGRIRIESELWRLNGDAVRQPQVPRIQRLEVPEFSLRDRILVDPSPTSPTALTIRSDFGLGATVEVTRVPGGEPFLVVNPTNRFDPFTGRFELRVRNQAGRAVRGPPWTAELPLDLTSDFCLDEVDAGGCFFTVRLDVPGAAGDPSLGSVRFSDQIALLSIPVEGTAFPERWTTGQRIVTARIITRRRNGDPAGTPTAFQTFEFTATGFTTQDRISLITPLVVDEFSGIGPNRVPFPLRGFLRATIDFPVDRLCDGPNADQDAWPDACDNCPLHPNDPQRDRDQDGIGDACECGDANGDGRVDTSDARMIQMCAVGRIPCSGLCDVDADGVCNTTDARLVQRFGAGQLTKGDFRCTVDPCRGDCDDGNPCTADRCEQLRCVNDPLPMEGLACNDGDACTVTDLCVAGTCAGMEEPDCDDAQSCTVDRCDPVLGCVNDPTQLEGTGCDDGRFCTIGDTCTGGVCRTSPHSCSDGNPCTRDSCDEERDTCINDPVPADRAACEDGRFCTVGDICQGGVCIGQPRDCDDLSACTLDSCNELENRCDHNGSVFHGDPCDDADACTVVDQCVAGVCSGTPRDCGDGNRCTPNGCVPDDGPLGG